jgi:hypothetical protein
MKPLRKNMLATLMGGMLGLMPFLIFVLYFGTRRHISARVAVVVAHYNEDLRWLERSVLPLSICSKTLTEWRDLDASCCHKENIADQHIHFVKWILANYRALPPHIAFIDAHERDWHGNFRILDYLRCLIDDPALPQHDIYHPLTGISGDHSGNYEQWGKRWHEIKAEQEGQMQRLWDIISYHSGAPCPTRISHHCCAQFLVTRDRILKRPRESWLELYHFIVDAESPITTHSPISYALEYSWHMLMGDSPETAAQKPLGSLECVALRAS